MRRPSPLPPPSSPAPNKPTDEATAPVIPITAPVAVPADGAAAGDTATADGRARSRDDATPGSDAAPAAGERDADASPSIDGEQPVRVSDVWRASRARRRALRAEVRRFTGRQRRRRMVWVGAISAVVLLVLATLGAAYSPLLAVTQITVVGADRLVAEDVEDALAGQLDTPLPLVDESAVKAALVEFPLIESYTLEARPPHELVVQIIERTPVGVIETAAGFTLVDAAGVPLATTQKQEGDAPLIDVRGGTDSDAFAAIGQVMRTLPESIRSRVTQVAATSPNDVTLTLGDTNTDVVWGSADDSAIKALNLEKIMATRTPEDVSVYDVSSPTVVVVR